MCTVLILRNVHSEWPLVLAANRDEFYARPAHGPRILSEAPRAVGGQDVERGGTWMGVTHEGTVVALTNQRGARGLGTAPRSRGEVVLRALQAGSVEAIERYLGTLPAPEFLPFNLLYGDARTLRVAYARPGHPHLLHEDVPSGVHVLPNDSLDNLALPKVQRAHALAEAVAKRPWPELVTGLQAALADHALPPGRRDGAPGGERPARGLPPTAPSAVHPHGGIRHALVGHRRAGARPRRALPGHGHRALPGRLARRDGPAHGTVRPLDGPRLNPAAPASPRPGPRRTGPRRRAPGR